MATTITEPRDIRLLTRYSELESYLQQFAEGLYRFLWVTGRPGVGKSELIQAITRDRTILYVKSGRLSPLSLYLACYEHLNQPIVLDLDEMEALLKDPDGRRLFLALGETTLSKKLEWHSTTPRLGNTPTIFETSSTLCVIANEPPRHPAIRSRATILGFYPTNYEVYAYAARWFWDQEIQNWVGRHLSRLHPIDLRCYLQAYGDKLGGRDWANLLMKAYALDAAEVVVQDLWQDPAYPTRGDKERRFIEIMAGRKGGSRANYHIILRRLRKSNRLEPETVDPILVRGKRPPIPLGLEAPCQQAADLPQRDGFSRPVTGQTRETNAQPQRRLSDDTVGGEQPPSADEDE
jgi:hypothetical protein